MVVFRQCCLCYKMLKQKPADTKKGMNRVGSCLLKRLKMLLVSVTLVETVDSARFLVGSLLVGVKRVIF